MTEPSRAYSEKRNFIRMKIETPAMINIVTGAEKLSGICHDLSGGGMLVEVEKEVHVGDELDITLSSAHGHNPMLKAKTRVTRATPNGSGCCTLGLEIVEMLS